MIARIVLIGESQVGKTSLVHHYLSGSAIEGSRPTVGAIFHSREVQCNGQSLVLQIWDTAGQEKYRAIGPIYYRGAVAAIAVFDQTRPETMAALKPWIEAFRTHATDKFVLIAANKADLDGEIRIQLEEIAAFAAEVGAQFICTSALSGFGIPDVFNMIAEHVLDSGTAGKAGEIPPTDIEESCC
jgi:small GTP-binding protein